MEQGCCQALIANISCTEPLMLRCIKNGTSGTHLPAFKMLSRKDCSMQFTDNSRSSLLPACRYNSIDNKSAFQLMMS